MESLAALLLLIAQEEPAEPPPPKGGRGETMDYGPAFCHTISKVKAKKDEDILAFKGVTVRVAGDAAMCFDTDLLRMAGGWTGGFVDLAGTHYVSYKGSIPPTLKGTLKFTSPVSPGWADFRDPRPGPWGPLPTERGRWRGHHIHGERVVLSYTIGECEVLELPGIAGRTFTRTIRLGASPQPATLLVCGSGPEVSVVHGPKLEIETTGDRVLLTVPPRTAPVTFTVAIGPATEIPAPPDLEALCKGGPARWMPALTTQGKLGAEEPNALDTLTVPEANPWNSWLRFTGLDFFSDGRAAVCTWNGDVWVVSGIDGTLAKISWKRFAAGMYEPLGLRIVDDAVHVLGRDQITRLRDLNGDGEADFHENFNNMGVVMSNYHAFAFDLHTDREGNFYTAKDGHRVDSDVPLHGAILKIPKDGRGIEIFATGFRAPNGMAVGPNGEITAGDNQGNWMPASKISWVKKDGFYGYVPHAGGGRKPEDFEKPICWIPHALDNSSGGQVWVTGERWGPLQGQLLHMSYGTASLFQVLHEFVEGQAQGGVIRFPLTFDSGIMRARFNPRDGQLYVAGLKGWQTRGARDACLQRVRYTGKPVRMVRELHVRKRGLELVITDPVDRASAADPDNWGAQQWNYLWSPAYGSPEFSVADPKKKGRDPVTITGIKVSEDGRTVTLEIPDLRPVMQMRVQAKFKSADGAPIHFELHNTINRIP